ncbi:lipoprotein [Streptomyces venetus]|uniref:Lipoprotein n=1 Tax=Streptomyces venetus TaxID=1701086 RepID=A0ABP8GLY7_9ACTN
MRGICVATAVLLGAGALTSCVPAADAAVQSDFGFSVDPSTVNPGGKVTLRVDRNACRGEAAVSSPVFDVVTIAPWQSWTTAVVDWNAEPGDVYDVEFVCERTSGTARLTISGRPPADHPGHHPGHDGRHPSKGVHAGEGGTLAGFDLKEIGLGGVLIAGSLGAAYHFTRRRTDEDAT